MANIVLSHAPDLTEKVALMQRDARYEVTDADLTVFSAASVRQSIRSQRALPKVPKVFLTNDCIFNCAYCGCRSGNEYKQRYASTPRELAELSYRQAREGKHGILLSSAILGTPDLTQEMIIQTLKILRNDLCYGGYVHAKVMPGADPRLIEEAGRYASRLSVNIEVARSEGYTQIARNKNKQNILTPMGQISSMIAEARAARGRFVPHFATSQTTQMMAGSTQEDDYTILRLSGALYRKYRLSRVYYTAFHFEGPACGYEHLQPTRTPSWRMNRLYQADRLMQQYGFSAEEIAPEADRFLQRDLDPKAAWALRNLHLFPVEVNRAEYELLLRVPGIGLTAAKRIMEARRYGVITHESLRALGVRVRRCQHFITCNGRYQGTTCENPARLLPFLADPPEQLSLFSSPSFPAMAGCGG